MKLKFFIFISAILLFIVACGTKNRKDKNSITVFCAAGLTGVISELNDSFTNPDKINIKLNLASSGTLARQLAQGNPCDVYIAASKNWADYSDSLRLFEQRKALYQNALVLICPLNHPLDSINFQQESLPLFDGYLSMGDPAHVPAGKYAEEALKNLGWWNDLQGRILPAKDVRSALMPVELGECEYGIVYFSDAMASKNVKIIGHFPYHTHSPIIFHGLLSKKASEAAKDYFDALTDSSFREIWMKHGLTQIAPN